MRTSEDVIGNVHFLMYGFFNLFAPSYHNTSLTQCYCRNELEKRRAYDEGLEKWSTDYSLPLFFSVAGGMGAIAKVELLH